MKRIHENFPPIHLHAQVCRSREWRRITFTKWVGKRKPLESSANRIEELFLLRQILETIIQLHSNFIIYLHQGMLTVT